MAFFSVFLVVAGLITALFIAVEVHNSRQHMKIMKVTWPVTGLYMPVLGIFFWRRLGKRGAQHQMQHDPNGKNHSVMLWQSAFISATHCGAGCVIGDIISAPLSAITKFTINGSPFLGHTLISFVAAFIFGIIFQYLPIREMGEKSAVSALGKAIKADTLSLTAFQAAMFLFLWIIRDGDIVTSPDVSSIDFWATMIIAMFVGYLVSVPVNYFLIKSGVKHEM